MKDFEFKHGGNIYSKALKLNLPVSEIIDASASIIPFETPNFIKEELYIDIKNNNFKHYPEIQNIELRNIIGEFHNINPEYILPGNGASELITWAAYIASKCGKSCLPIPGFVDYERALDCWDAEYIFHELPRNNFSTKAQEFPIKPKCKVLWITNPHNPTGQLWERRSLEKIINHYEMVICDEAFLSITPKGEVNSLIPLIKKYKNLIIIRSLTKLFGIPGLRIGYMVSSPNTLEKINKIRDPWPLNSFAITAGKAIFKRKNLFNAFTKQIHSWILFEKDFLFQKLSQIKDIKVYESAANFFLMKSKDSLIKNIKYLENKGILIRDCSSFRSLDEKWARISLKTHEENKKIALEIYKSFL